MSDPRFGTRQLVDRIRQLPIVPREVWQGAIVRMPAWIHPENGEPFRPYGALWVSHSTGRLTVELGEGDRPRAGRVVRGEGAATDAAGSDGAVIPPCSLLGAVVNVNGGPYRRRCLCRLSGTTPGLPPPGLPCGNGRIDEAPSRATVEIVIPRAC